MFSSENSTVLSKIRVDHRQIAETFECPSSHHFFQTRRFNNKWFYRIRNFKGGNWCHALYRVCYKRRRIATVRSSIYLWCALLQLFIQLCKFSSSSKNSLSFTPWGNRLDARPRNEIGISYHLTI